jgi:hypothetical protein
LYRLLCHTIIQQLPDTAFQEAVESLKDMWEFYAHTPKLPEPLPVATSKLQGKVTEVREYVAQPIFED